MPADGDILTPLRDDDFGPPSVDLSKAMRTGRRRILARRTGAAALSVAGVLAIASIPLGINSLRSSAPAHRPAAASPAVSATTTTPTQPTPLSCQLTYLKSPDNVYMSAAHGVSPNGRYIVGHSYVTGFVWQPVLWDNGKPHKAGPKGSDTDLTAVNDSGVAIGSSYHGDVQYGVVWRNGQLTKLNAPDGFEPRAISASGEIVGTVTTKAVNEYPYVLDSPTSAARKLPLPGKGWVGEALAVGSDGTIVGRVADSMRSEQYRGVLWHPDGTYKMLPVPSMDSGTVDGFGAERIFGSLILGEVYVHDARGSWRVPASYDLSSGAYHIFNDIGPFFFSDATADLTIVGDPAEIYTPASGVQKLPQPDNNNREYNQVFGVSADGHTISGNVQDGKGKIRATVWNCH